MLSRLFDWSNDLINSGQYAIKKNGFRWQQILAAVALDRESSQLSSYVLSR